MIQSIRLCEINLDRSQTVNSRTTTEEQEKRKGANTSKKNGNTDNNMELKQLSISENPVREVRLDPPLVTGAEPWLHHRLWHAPFLGPQRVSLHSFR